MDITLPVALKYLATAGTAIKKFALWGKKAKGDARSLILEIKDNFSYLELVAIDGVDLGEVIEKMPISEYQRLSKEGFSFNSLKKEKIKNYPSLDGSDLSSWVGKDTEDLVGAIYDKIIELKIRYPHVSASKKYRWNVRVNNIRKRIFLLLKHVQS